MRPLRVAVLAADPERAGRFAAMLADAGHVRAGTAEAADVTLVDHPPGGLVPRGAARPALLLTDEEGLASDGFAGVLPREAGPVLLVPALAALAAGLQVRLAAAAPAGFAAAEEEAPAALLTPREMQILSAIGEGLSNKEVARRLGISAHTVKFHLEAVFAKLDAGSRAEAVAKGLRRGLIEL